MNLALMLDWTGHGHDDDSDGHVEDDVYVFDRNTRIEVLR